ncbi:MAG TPA: S49 family peptidase [Candidatus Competibacteraceae bacterium]|nr:S49 family peptidase [Candidatus Competibacteraceae bacterium]
MDSEVWARRQLLELARASLAEQRRARRWSLFFRLLVLGYVVVLTFLIIAQQSRWPLAEERHVALLRVEGPIAGNREASAETLIRGLRAAFEDERTSAVILRIDSPGGSPVQAGQVYDEIRRLRRSHSGVPVYAVIEDMGASGAYYIAVAADRIYADKASIVGSIGVRADGFGFVGLMDKLGIERRSHTAGDNKAMLDPFAPEKPEQVRHLQGLLNEVHQQFIDAVRQGRGERLAETEHPELFSGLVWSGQQAQQLGLVDGLASVRQVAEEVVKVERIVDFTPRRRVLERLLDGLGVRLGTLFDGAFNGLR